ncbi:MULTISPECIES: NADPH-dependent FMN reductase [unclassified Streptosporangium]|uniref:NADPH-dependent FMN reductase n=1 Tax=unclassified Streptosporangium TaxID=2632669 RepID=UPI002E2CD5B1|nr:MULTISPECIES: NAD(P)H-dependent oxidoreductase [unclassified Streptosporangium]
MSDNKLKLAVVVGSVREGRFGPTVANWFVGEAERHQGFQVDLIDLAEVPIGSAAPSMSPAPEVLRALGGLTPRLEAADAFVMVTPEYNHSFPAALKSAIDWHSSQFHAKPVAFVSYGGISGGLRAVEHLRLVFAELHAVTTRDTVSFHGAWTQFEADGQPKDPDGPATAAKTLLDQVTWWASALRDAKTTRPYTA